MTENEKPYFQTNNHSKTNNPHNQPYYLIFDVE